MSENNYSDGVSKTRPVLGDVTNRVCKRGFSLISGNSGAKSGDLYCENLKNKEEISKISKRDCASPYTCSEINSLKGNAILSISKIQTEAKNPDSSNCQSLILGLGDGSRDSCVSNKDFVETRDENREEEGISNEVAEANCLGLNDGNGVNLDDLESTKCGSLDFSRLPESQESRSSGLEKCVGLKGDGCSDSNAGVDLIKSCSCSFCTKAAYIWSDLHYQDIKGRIAALKKSQKEANVLVQRSLRSQGIESNKISKVESDLNGQWRSLFLHMEDIFGRESSQLEASLFTLKDLRDNCKTELDSANGSSSSGKQ